MDAVKIAGLAAKAPGVADTFRQILKVDVSIEGSDVIVPKESSEELASRPALVLNKAQRLDVGRIPDIAAALVQQVPPELWEHVSDSPASMRVSHGYGIISDLDNYMDGLWAHQNVNDVSQCLIHIVQAMKSKFGATRVVGVSANAEAQEAAISATKLFALLEKFSLGETGRFLKKRALRSILPGSADVLSFLDPLTRFTPYFVSLPVHYRGCVWHFHSSEVWELPLGATNGVGDIFSSALTPASSNEHFIGFGGLREMDGAQIADYFDFMHTGINRLFSYANDFRMFARPDGNVDMISKLKMYGALLLIFSDLQGLQTSSNTHNRISFALSILDKLANLRARATGEVRNEGEVFRSLACRQQCERLKETIGSALLGQGLNSLAASFRDLVDRCYGAIGDSLQSMHDAPETGERKSLDRFWSLRNLRHGTFLRGDQYEEVFFETPGRLPQAIATLAYVLVVGLLSNPEGFLKFQPILDG